MPIYSFNSVFSWIIKKRIHQIDLFRKHPIEVQNEVLETLLTSASDTEFGKKHQFENIKSYSEFKKKVPLNDYESLKPYVDRLLKNEQQLLWNTDILWFAKSSGTTKHKSKFIPVSKESLQDCHYKGGKDLLSLYYNQLPDRKLYMGKHLIVGGSSEINYFNPKSYFGDLSSIILKNMPWWAEIRRTPSRNIALMSHWEEKIEKMAQSTIKEDVYILAGVPSWTLVLCKRVLEITGKSNLREVWPHLELFMHGGVSFDPYREEFKKLIPYDDMNYVETFNASEGFFGIQDDFKSPDLLLMLDYGIFYEFIPMDQFEGKQSKTILSLEEVELNVNYAMVISTNAGLWRYILGDTIRFTSISPYKFVISGRTKSYLNTFGEELVVENAEKAIAKACLKTQSQIKEYTAGPIFMTNKNKGGHEWVIEFIKAPSDLAKFATELDQALKELNSDYEAKRTANLSIDFPKIRVVKTGTFDQWLKKNGKLGGQHKIPRLMNDRSILDELMT